MRLGLPVISGKPYSASGQSRHLFPRLFFVGTSSGVAGEIHPGMILAQFIPSLPLEAGSSIERPANICLSEPQPPRDNRLARINDFHCYCETADWLAKLRAGFGIDIRTPAFDRRLVEFCIGIPEDQYLRNGCDRWLIRRAMKGRLPDVVLYNKKIGDQAADWYPRLTRERNHIAEEVKRLAANVDVASIVDLQRLTAILDDWPERQPPEYSPEKRILLAIPQALGAAYFIENVTGVNYRG